MGCTLAVLGFSMYSYASIEGRQRRNLTVYTSKAEAAQGKQPADASDAVTNPLLDPKVSQV